jgi:hypothetical protein
MAELPDNTGTFLGERPASSGARRAIESSRPRLPARLRALVSNAIWIVPLTLLIWLYAEREQLARESVAVPVSIRSAVPNRLITPARQVLTLELRGPRVQIEQFRREIAATGGGIEVALDRTPGRDHEVQWVAALGESPSLRRNGITVVKAEPSMSTVVVDEIVEKDAIVTAPDLGARLDGPVVFEPRRIRVRGPASVLAAREASGDPLAVAELSTLPQVQQPGSHSGVTVSIRPLGDQVTFSPSSVSADFRVVEERTRQYRIPSVIIEVRKPLALEGSVEVATTPQVLSNIDVVGPIAVIEQMERDAARGVAPAAVLRITAEDFAARRGTKPVRFDLPDGVRLVGEPRTVDFTVADRDADPNN